jgi:hypothetical protein
MIVIENINEMVFDVTKCNFVDPWNQRNFSSFFIISFGSNKLIFAYLSSFSKKDDWSTNDMFSKTYP